MLLDDLTKEQKEVINIACGKFNVLVDACIGSGKTTTINILCNEYIKNYPDSYIVYLTYSALLKFEAQYKIGTSNPNIFATSYHGYAYKYISNKCKDSVSNYIKHFIAENPAIPSIDLLIIDEYQDIDTEIAEMLTIIKQKNPNMQIVAVGDMDQKIYDKTTLDVRAFIIKFLGNYIPKTFTYCFRLNNEYAQRIGKIWEKPIIGVNDKGHVHTMTIEEACKYLIDKPLGNILALGKQNNGIASALLNKLETTLNYKFNKDTVFVKNNQNHTTLTYDNMDKVAIFTTYDGSKGLERPICIITDFNQRYIEGRIALGTKPNILKNIVCVAMSRGKRDIIFVQPTERELRLENINSDPKNRLLLKDEQLSDLKYRFIIPAYITVEDLMAYKYNENINKCFDMITKIQIETNDNEIINHNNKCGYIDLTKQNMPFILANFFNNYNIEDETTILASKYKTVVPDWMQPHDADSSTRVIAFIKTGQLRYYTQVTNLNFTESEIDKINNRLSNVFTGDEEFVRTMKSELSDIMDIDIIIQTLPKNISKKDLNEAVERIENMELIFDTYLMIDKTYYALIFNQSKDSEHSVSTTMRDAMIEALFVGLAFGMEKTIVWNIQTNKMYEISTPDKDKFIANVVCTYLNLQLPY